MEVLPSLYVLFVLIFLGFLSRKLNVFKKKDIRTLSSFIYYFGLPALFFAEIASADLLKIDAKVFLGSILPILFSLSFLFLLKKIKILSKESFIIFGISSVFGSNAFFGIAFFQYFKGGKWIDLSIITASLLGSVGIILSIILFEYAKKTSGGILLIKKVFTNPLIVSIIAAVVISFLDLNLSFILSPMVLLGKASASMAIFVLGVFIYDNFSLKNIRASLFYSSFRIIAFPIITYLSILALPELTLDTKTFLFFQGGIPAAISLAVFSERYDYKLSEISGMVVMTSVASFFLLITLSFLSKILI